MVVVFVCRHGWQKHGYWPDVSLPLLIGALLILQVAAVIAWRRLVWLRVELGCQLASSPRHRNVFLTCTIAAHNHSISTMAELAMSLNSAPRWVIDLKSPPAHKIKGNNSLPDPPGFPSSQTPSSKVRLTHWLLATPTATPITSYTIR